MVLGFFKNKKEKKIVRWIHEQIVSNEDWRVMALGNKWLCPYCGDVAVEIFSDAEVFEKIQTHITKQCNKFAPFTLSNFSKKELIDIAFNLYVDEMLKNEQRFFLLDRNDYWFCPFCAKSTDIRFPLDMKLTDNIKQNVKKHLATCFSCAQGKGAMKTLDQLKRLLKEWNSILKLTSNVKNNIVSNPVWRVKSKKGNWYCPYCKQSVAGINISSNIVMMENAPMEIAKHLLYKCISYKEGKPPVQRKEELEVVVASQESGKPDETHSTMSVELIKSLEKEIQEMKSKVKQTIDIQKSLEEARKKQMQLLPKPPSVKNFEFSTYFKPCDYVAGDFYDFTQCGENILNITIGDVSGHGMQAAIVMGVVKKALQIHSSQSKYPTDIIKKVGGDILKDIDRKTFITVCLGMLNTKENVIKIVRAGHPPPILYNPRRDPPVRLIEPRGVPLGIRRKLDLEKYMEVVEVGLLEDDLILFYTDGLTEARNNQDCEFGLENLIDIVKRCSGAKVEELSKVVDEEISKFLLNTEPQDDITFVCVKRKRS